VLVPSAEIVAHPQVHFIPNKKVFHIEEFAYYVAQREKRKAVEHDVNVPVVPQNTAALPEKHSVCVWIIK
jgi:hypothetical protein